jgi:hypothetical protein
MTSNSQDPKAPIPLYDSTIDKYEDWLDRLETAFNNRCEEIRIATHQKLDALPKNDLIGRKKVLEEEKIELDQAVRELKEAVGKGGRDTRKTLEKIQAQMDDVASDVENELDVL